jgi:Uma2 family endonuclease
LSYDQEVKIPVYARGNIPEVWVVDLNSASVHVYRAPTATGYQEHTRVQSGAALVPQAFSDCALPVAGIVGDSP